MITPTRREVRRLELKATWFRILARHSHGLADQTRWLELARDEDCKTVELQLQAEGPASLSVWSCVAGKVPAK
jgi:hypothetical protein